MHEKAKLGEAEHFLALMAQDRNDPAPFKYWLSAFLSAARSVLQYAREEARSRARGQAWYDRAVSTRDLVVFMKDQRDANIHVEPVALNNDVTIALSGIVAMAAALTAVLHRADGAVTATQAAESAPAPLAMTQPPVSAKYTFRFPRWPYPHDVLTLCTDYLDQLCQVVDDGIGSGFISG